MKMGWIFPLMSHTIGAMDVNWKRGVDGQFSSSTILKGMAVVYIKVSTFIARCVSAVFTKVIRGKHLKTTKHSIACGDIVVEAENQQCWKCRGHMGLEMFRRGNASCNGCLAHREKWAGNNPGEWRNYGRNIARKIEKRLMMERSVEWNGGGLCCLRVQGDEKQMGKACWDGEHRKAVEGEAVMDKMVNGNASWRANTLIHSF